MKTPQFILGLEDEIIVDEFACGDGQPGARRWSHGAKDIREPVGTVTASGGGQALAVGTLVQMGYGEREGQAPRSMDVHKPLGTVVGAGKFAAVTAFVEQANGGFNTTPARDAREPLSTSTASGSQQRVVAVTLISNTSGHAPTDLRSPVSIRTPQGVASLCTAIAKAMGGSA